MIFSNTSSYYADKSFWAGRITLVSEKGLQPLVGANMERWFTEDFRKREPAVMQKMTDIFLGTKVDGYIGCCAAIRDMDFRASNPTIKAPVLVIVGAKDPATTPAAGEEIQKSIPGAKLAALDAAHIANMEQPKRYTETMLNFLRN
ncbi:MAG: alpha/beta fold hydrolase [Pseudolabrys sp.]|nr:alpha/beta fold hydrolase [Pseudolabrys sp.]